MSARPLVAALAAVLALLAVSLTGCSTPSSSADPTGTATADLSTVLVSGAVKTKPTVTVPTPLSVSTTKRTVLAKGTGPVAAAGERVTIEYVGYNGTDGKEFDTSYGHRPVSFVLDPGSNLKGLVSSLIGTPAGSRILLAVPPADAYGLEGRPAAGIGPTDTLVLVVDLLAVEDVLTRATGAAVAPKAGLPTVKLNAKGAPTITLPGEAPPPTTLIVQPLIVGKGSKVAKGQQVTVHYTGVLWPRGKQFDSSWGRTPSSFEIGTGKVISGWDRGLVGQTVGSQILLVIPPDDGYGAEGRSELGIKGTDTLVFVVDILDAA